MVAPDVSDEKVKNLSNLLGFLKKLAADGVTPLIEKQILQMLDDSLEFFVHLIIKGYYPEIYRWTINKRVVKSNKRIWCIKDLKYPPPEMVTKYGRCNLPGQSALYASNINLTAASECRPDIGDLITRSTWKYGGSRELNICPIFKNQPTKKAPDGSNIVNLELLNFNEEYEKKLSVFPPNVKTQIDALTQFIADAFTKDVNPSNDLDYIFSAYFSNKIFYDLEEGSIDAILYPSVAQRLSFQNLAVKPYVFDDCFQLVEVVEQVCAKLPSWDFRGIITKGISNCKSFDYASGKILWDPRKIYQPPEEMLAMKTQYGVDIDLPKEIDCNI